eukprot:scaffold236_cov419-Prasinococcus_capsulatus_cf.AAC.13
MYPVFYLRYGLLFVGRLVDGTGLGLVFSWYELRSDLHSTCSDGTSSALVELLSDRGRDTRGALVLMPPAHDKQPPNSIVSTFLRGVLMLINGNGKDTSGQPLTIEGPDMGTIMIPHLGFGMASCFLMCGARHGRYARGLTPASCWNSCLAQPRVAVPESSSCQHASIT